MQKTSVFATIFFSGFFIQGVLLAALLFSISSTQAAVPDISYEKDIAPIFAHRCVACHACYDAPCQLNLSNADGVQRGASKTPVYGVPRTQAMHPTRLFVDATDIAGWRALGFYSVIEPAGAQASLMARMLSLGSHRTITEQTGIPAEIHTNVERSNQCPATDTDWQDYLDHHAQEGMPFMVAGLSHTDLKTLQQWLAAGAPVVAHPVEPTRRELLQINQWEHYLNQPDPRHQLLSRWLYEHWVVAHLYFPFLPPGHFFELIRSSTPPGMPIEIIASRSANDPPPVHPYYRMRPIQGSLVYKTHITFPLDSSLKNSIEQLFFSSQWDIHQAAGYDESSRANPFLTFSDLPVAARYQFMLEHAEYFVRTFIRGPVCRGQLATDVIRDNFWTFFQDPRYDLYVTDADYRQRVSPLLALPGQLDGLLDLPKEWLKYRHLRNEYEKLRQNAYRQEESQGAGFKDLWTGNGVNTNALLSIFRHGNSATVHRGLLGAPPQTLWLLDFPLLEQTYYELVVNFDVFGTLSHQTQTRLYFDLIRFSAENNFLRLMPPTQRQLLLDDWYQDSGRIKLWLDYSPVSADLVAADPYFSADAKTEFEQRLLQRSTRFNATPDPINRCSQPSGCSRTGVPPFVASSDKALSQIAASTPAQLPAILFLPEASLLRIYNTHGQQTFYTLLRNRAHSNVAFILGEDLRYQPERDSITIAPGLLTSYPNFAFNIASNALPTFLSDLRQVRDSAQWQHLLAQWGVRRLSPEFWPLFDHLLDFLRTDAPVEAAIPDLNRYEKW